MPSLRWTTNLMPSGSPCVAQLTSLTLHPKLTKGMIDNRSINC